MKTRSTDILVGIFVIALSGLLIAGVLWFSSSRPGQAYDEYLVYMQESVAGLSRDSSVKFYGVEVGRVHEISLGSGESRQVRLLLQLDHNTPITRDTVATLETQGLTGLAFINLRGSTNESPPLTRMAGEQYPVIPSEPSTWGRLDRSIAELADNLIQASARINDLLSEQNQRLVTDNLSQLFALLNQLSEHSRTLTQGIQDLARTLHNTRESSEQLPTLAEQWTATADALKEMAHEIGSTAISVRETVSTSGREIDRLTQQSSPELQAVLEELLRTAENFRRLSEQLERNPQMLLYGRPQVAPGPGE